MSTKNAIFRCRIDPVCLEQAEAVAVELGTSTSELCRMFFWSLCQAKRQGVIDESKRLDRISELWSQLRIKLERNQSIEIASWLQLDATIRGVESKNASGQAAAAQPIKRDERSER